MRSRRLPSNDIVIISSGESLLSAPARPEMISFNDHKIYFFDYSQGMEKNQLVKPYLKWAGGKRQLAPEIVRLSPKKYRRYYEPFVGAGAILFTLQPKNATINDLNEQLCLTYKVIRDDVESLIELLEIHKANNSQEYYYRARGGGNW